MLTLRGIPRISPVFSTVKRAYITGPEVHKPPDPSHTHTKAVESTDEFRFVDRLLSRETVGPVPEKSLREYPTPSGWIPPAATVPNLPYFVGRTRYHSVPVYLRLADKAQTKKLTGITKIHGDIWALDEELRKFIRALSFDGLVATQVSEVNRRILIKGNYVEEVKQFLLEKGF